MSDLTASRGYKWVVRVAIFNTNHFSLMYERATAKDLDNDEDILAYDADPREAVRSAIDKITKHIDQCHDQIKCLALQAMASVMVGKKKSTTYTKIVKGYKNE